MRTGQVRRRAVVAGAVLWVVATIGLPAASFPPPAHVAAQPRPPFTEETIERLTRAALLQHFDPASSFEVSVTGTAITGDTLSVDELAIVGRPAIIRGVHGDLVVHAAGLRLDLRSLANQTLQVRRVAKGTVVAKTTAKAVQNGLAAASAAVIRPAVKFHLGEFDVSATIKRENALYPVHVRGTLVVERRQKVWVKVAEAQISGGDVPESIIEEELARINPVLDLSRWPLALIVQRLTLHNDTVEILGITSK